MRPILLHRIVRKINKELRNNVPFLRNKYHESVYKKIDRDLKNRYIPFLNYGYSYNGAAAALPKLDERDKPYQYHAQLYHFVTSPVALPGLNVLEVGSGRGGGCYYMKRYLGASLVTGVEYVEQNVNYARETFPENGLIFKRGNAEELPCDNGVYDVVVNIESSHCYPRIEKFLYEVIRALKPGGYFLYADIGSAKRIMELETTINTLPLRLLQTVDITSNVIKSLSGDNSRKLDLIKEFAPNKERERWWINEWGCIGSQIWLAFSDRSWLYKNYTLRKEP